MRFVFFIVLIMSAGPAMADTLAIGPDYRFSPGDACHAPVVPGTNDEAAMSRYQAERQKFIDCAAHRPSGSQADLDRSLAAIGDDQNSIHDQAQQQARGTALRLDREDSHK